MVAVRDVHGHVVWRVVVPRLEMTCVDCGETTGEEFCPRCGFFELDGGYAGGANLVLTASYLLDHEMVLVG